MLSGHSEGQQAAQRLVDGGQYHEAIRLYRSVLEANPGDLRALLGIGDVYLRVGEHEKALSAYERVAEHYCRDDHWSKAIAVYRHIHHIIATHAPHLEPRYRHTIVREAQLCATVGRGDDALAAYDRAAAAVRLDGNEQDAWCLYDDFAKRDPDNPLAHLRVGESCARLGALDAAVDHMGKAASGLVTRGQRDEALRVIELLLACRSDPTWAAMAAKLYLDRGDPRDAVAAVAKLQICFRADSTNLAVLASLAHAFEQVGEPGKAIEVRKQAATTAWRKGETSIFDDLVVQLAIAIPDDPAVDELLALRAGVIDADDTVTDAEVPEFDDSTEVMMTFVDEDVTVVEPVRPTRREDPRLESAEDTLDRILREAWGESSIDTSPPPEGPATDEPPSSGHWWDNED
ncbi:MAG: tetratricopeptide repeat protein [Deltaproteobacteria bacterium]|nr:tetratricopeptide repeat protein [Deltaproteobacteria bacterium]